MSRGQVQPTTAIFLKRSELLRHMHEHPLSDSTNMSSQASIQVHSFSEYRIVYREQLEGLHPICYIVLFGMAK